MRKLRRRPTRSSSRILLSLLTRRTKTLLTSPRTKPGRRKIRLTRRFTGIRLFQRSKNKDIVNKSEDKARTEKDKINEEVHRDQALSEIEELEQVNADLHKSCDFLMKNWETRTTARDEEIEALKQGLALFSGASFGAFL